MVTLLDDQVSAADALREARRLFDAGENQEAERFCREVLKREPANAAALNQLAEVTHRSGAPLIAIALARRAVALAPVEPRYQLTLGAAMAEMGRVSEAEAVLARARELDPTNSQIVANLSSCLIGQGRFAEALELVRAAIAEKPDDPLLYQSRGVVQWWMARQAEARESFRRAVELAPSYAPAESGILFSQHYIEGCEAEAQLADARAWAARHTAKLTGEIAPHRNRPDPERRLRVGYVSGDFQQHPVGRIVQSVIPAHDPARVEVYCYSNHWINDGVTRTLRASAAQWRSLVHLNDEAAAELIRSDEIDILVDLSGHTAKSRLMVLARKPAPVQAMWLGYFDTTGLPTVDYILADQHVCPPGDEPFYVEKIARLPHSFLCFTPPESGPEVAPPPARRNGYVTFGCLNNVAKVTTEGIDLWARILQAVPGSQFQMKAGALNDPVVREQFTARFALHDVAPERLRFEGSSPYAVYLRAYDEIDLALDSFPFNGGHTTLDALWMGAPVLALRGRRFVGRMGASILSTLDLNELIAESSDDYVEKAIALAADRPRLAELRAGLRERMRRSPLCDGAAMARGLEARYREMWQAWCRRQPERTT